MSVVVPTRDRLSLLRRAVESVRSQTFDDLEIIVTDDGSSDGTIEWALDQAAPLRLVRTTAPPGSGPGPTRNRALEEARGELIAFLDDDDTWTPDKLAVQVHWLDANPGHGFVFSDGWRLTAPTTLEPLLRARDLPVASVFDALLEGCFVHPSTLLVRHSLIDEVGGFDPAPHATEDYDFFLRLAMASPGGVLPNRLSIVRRLGDQRSRRHSTELHVRAAAVVKPYSRDERLSLAQRRRAKLTASRLLSTAGQLDLEAGDRREARRHFIRSLRLRPFQRFALRGLVESMLLRRESARL
ncbi:MAG: glycosyltransferase family A protein [Nitriliruptorales bacterium]|nr:glycosyltransferase family A protein [Nitriliruptorales bacterium]